MATTLIFIVTVLLSYILGVRSSWNVVTTLDTMDPKEVKGFISPLVDMSMNGYSYPNLQPVVNWTLASKLEPLAPKQAGVHALVFQEQAQEQRLVLSFRGTLTQADACVDLLLFGADALPRGMQLPNKDVCNSMFDGASLDYVSQAADYTKRVLQAYPGTPLLLTGHSLGAALAILVSATLSKTQVLPVVAFSSPGTRKILEDRSLRLEAEQENKVFVFADQWDGVVRTLWDRQVGSVCLVEYPEPSSCVSCSRSSSSDNVCRQCIFETHSVTNVVQLLDDGKSKLVCQNNFSASIRLPQGAPVDSSGFALGIHLVLVVFLLFLTL